MGIGCLVVSLDRVDCVNTGSAACRAADSATESGLGFLLFIELIEHTGDSST